MGAFFLCKKGSDYANSDFDLIFRKLGFSGCIHADFGNYDLYVYPKLLISEKNYKSDALTSVYANGTLSYKGLSYRESIEVLGKDHSSGDVDYEKLRGHYFVFIKKAQELKILNDGSSLLVAYHDDKGSFLTSSFIVASGIIKVRKFSRETVQESLVTGGIIGKSTLIEGLNKFIRSSAVLFNGLSFHFPVPGGHEQIDSRISALNYISENLQKYMDNFSALANQYGVDIGLTGGFDSRLLLGLALKSFRNIQVHSHCRNYQNKEYTIARKISTDMGIDFHSVPVTDGSLKDDDQLNYTMWESAKFYDGQVRLHCNWTEDYNTMDYRKRILRNKGIGFHGIGGEQYRNSDRIGSVKWNFDNWIRYRYIKRISGDVFLTNTEGNRFSDYLKDKIINSLGFKESKQKLDLADLKRINNEIFISSYRGIRTSVENKLSFFLSPFADFHNSSDAYRITGVLGSSSNFEIDMIKKISPGLSGFPSCYGYTFAHKEPPQKHLLNFLFENALPPYISFKFREIKKKAKYGGRHFLTGSSTARYIQNVRDLDLKIDLDKLMNRQDIYPLILSIGFLIEKDCSLFN